MNLEKPTDLVEIFHPIISKKAEVQRSTLTLWVEHGWVEHSQKSEPLPTPRPRAVTPITNSNKG